MESISYISKLYNLEKLYKDGEALLKKNEDIWDQIVEEEEANPIRLTMLMDKIDSTKVKMQELKETIHNIKLMLSN